MRFNSFKPCWPWFFGGVILTLGVWAAAASKPQLLDATPTGETVNQVILQTAQGFEGGDVAALGELFHPDVVVYERGQENYGWADFRDSHLVPELQNLTDIRYAYDNIVVQVQGSIAWARFDYYLEAFDLTQQQRFESGGIASMVLVLEGGRWRIVHLHMS